ncbi:uncharacterized protein HMPREF1541_00153 [Cyphellophora europaea CBS 101466]|uniref:Acyl-CoA dehydrogenase/oxidase C-terminal domain-containing protein n=1 Tax=Cyphellophora europaea (strain CBS 101466) TaxID=1220924 RepID=W2SB71_CYPE1|nr:uncharacterized protein HMPREF1541_00153 [Cyphellophora europaea CBS 101466]ETN45971.1 hypothetical protein HMPREF1541_00153 [Cyphellophora europaea CBS 101466]
MASSTFKPSTIDDGYRLSPSPLKNPFTSDHVYQRILTWYLPHDIYDQISPKLEQFAAESISPQVNEWIANAEVQQPYVKQYDAWGRRYPVDKLVTSDGWKRLGEWGARNGVVAHGYEPTYGPHRRIIQHAHNYIFSASSAVRSCPVSMTSGAARLLGKQLPSLPSTHPFHKVYAHLISRDDPWVSAQWMTERPGGSDVQNSETIAVHSPLPSKSTDHGTLEEGDYLLSGFKWFSSATDCDIALILARTAPSEPLSLFLAPTRLTTTDEQGQSSQITNGVRIHRLKTKMGTKELPTAELALHDTRAHLVGPVGRGIATIATLLNVTRTHNVFVALSCWRRGLDIAKAFARARETLDQPLWTLPMHLRLLATLELKHRAASQLAFFTTALLSYADNGHPTDTNPPPSLPLPTPGPQTEILLRALTATAKAIICKTGCAALQECQEALGGVGYLDDPHDVEWNVSRLYRDTAANMTWEGTTNVLASEVVRHLCNGRNLEVVGGWVGKAVGEVRESRLAEGLAAAWAVLARRLEVGRGGGGDIGAALADGRQLLFSWGWLVSGVLMARDAQRDGDAVAVECARRWILQPHGDLGYGEWVLPDVLEAARSAVKETGKESEKQQRNWDCRIVWGCDLPKDAALGYRAPVGSDKAKL